LHREFDETRRLRNHIAHHQPIHRRDLVGDHQRIMRLLGYISPAYTQWVQERDRSLEVLATRADVCAGSLAVRF
jgi:hypothetical protein